MHTQSVRGQNTTIRTIFKKSEAKTFHLKTQLSAQRRDNKYNRRRIKELSASRDNWKEKNSSKGKRIKVLSRQLERQDNVCRHHYPFVGGTTVRDASGILWLFLSRGQQSDKDFGNVLYS